MNFRTTLILALIFVIGVAGVILMNKQEQRQEKIKEIEGKLLNVDKEKIKEIMLEPSGIHVVREDDGWKIVEPIETEGDKGSINAIANMFGWAKIERSISDDPSEYAEFGLDPVRGKMIVIHEDGTDTLYLGDKSPIGSYVFARKSGAPTVFLTTTSLKTYIEKKLFDLRDKRVLAFEKNQVRAIHLKNGHGSFELEKEGGKWHLKKPMDTRADETEVNKILNRLNSARAKEFVEEEPSDLKKYGLHRPKVSVALLLGENKAQKTLLIGKKKEKRYFAKDESRKPVFLVDSSFVAVLNTDLKKLRGKKLADFVNSDVTKWEITFDDTTVVCEKDTASTWRITAPVEREAKSWKISSVNSAVTTLKVIDFVDDSPRSLKKYGLDKPRLTAKFYKDDELLLELLIGKKTGDDKVYVKTGDSKSVYTVKESVYESLHVDIKDISKEPKESSDSKNNDST